MKNVPVFILAGGLGTRLSEETQAKPKPMVEIGDHPILMHIMRWYYAFGFDDFVICVGYRSWDIKNYFLNYEFRSSHVAIDHRTESNTKPVLLGQNQQQEKWRVRILDTGVESMTGARLARALKIIGNESSFTNFALTYGDGLSNVDLKAEYQFHLDHEKIGTVLGVHPMARFGELDLNEKGQVQSFLEKPQSTQGLINGGFFFFKTAFQKYLDTASDCILERAPLSSLADDRELMVYKFDGFWQPMDTLRDKMHLQELWDSGQAPWLIK